MKKIQISEKRPVGGADGGDRLDAKARSKSVEAERERCTFLLEKMSDMLEKMSDMFAKITDIFSKMSVIFRSTS